LSDGIINKKKLDLILKEKCEIINNSQILEFQTPNEKFESIGGLDNLKKWLNLRKNCFNNKAKLYGLSNPRGLLLTGIQGTGKSMTAKAIANEWNLPLLKLDMGKIFAGIVGESENRIREMILLSESLSPCIVWLDEIDKIFNNQSNNFDSGTTNRVFATFLNWLSEKNSKVFIVATANDLSVLPLEFIRKGRFDEIFFLGLPTLNERKTIFEVILNKKRPKKKYLIDNLAIKTFGFSGAEIEQTIVNAMINAFEEKREFNENDILEQIDKIIPLYKLNPKIIDQMQNLVFSGKIRAASELEKKI